MPLSEILQLIAFALQEAPEILHLLASLVKMLTGDATDAKIDKFDEQAARVLNVLLSSARSTATAAASIDFGKVTDDAQKQARFDDVVREVKAVAAELGKDLSQGEAETIAQNGWALAFRAAGVDPAK